MPSTERRSLWWHLDFRRLWVGESVSVVGTAVTQLALPLVAILVVHASTFEVGALTAFDTLGFLVIGLPVGAWVDRMRFRLVLIVNDLVRVAVIASVPVAQLFGVLTIGQLFAVALLAGVCTVFFDVAYQSYLPELVAPDDLVEGNAKLQSSQSVAELAGPSLGGLLIQAITAPYALVVDAASFLWSAAWVSAIRQRPPRRERLPERNLRRDIGEGLRFVLGNRILRSVAACTGTFNLLSSMQAALLLILFARLLHLSPGAIGLLLASAAVGGLIGSLLTTRVITKLGHGPATWIAAAVSGPPALVPPFLHRDWTLGLFVATAFVMYAGIVVYNVAQLTFRQGLCPPELLGRMNATMRFLVWGEMPLGGLLGGALGSGIGIRPTLLIVGVANCLAFLPVFLSPLRHARELPRYEPVGSGT